MIEIALIIVIGRYYYQLADLFEKNKWVFAILGVLTFYGSLMIAGFLYGLVAVLSGHEVWVDINPILLSLMLLPIGLLAAWGLHRILKKNWTSKKEAQTENVIDEL